MKSFCIKLENNKQENFLIEQLEKIELKDLYISSYQFKIYKNVIVHYSGENVILFKEKISEAIANTIEQFYEKTILRKIIYKNYFYLNDDEQKTIFRISLRILIASKENDDFAKEILKELIYEYLR